MGEGGNEITVVQIVAWGAVVTCIVATVLCATRYAKRNVRLFTSLTFFALGWALLLPYYAWPGRSKELTEVVELLPAYSGFLLTLAGGPLRREAVVRAGHRDPGIGKHDVWVLHALYLIVLPHVFIVPRAPDFLRPYQGQIVMVLGTLFTVLGFYSILEGLGKLTENGRIDYWPWLLLRIVTLLYVALELFFTAKFLPHPEGEMSPPFKWAYAVFKLVFSALFLFLVVRQTQRHRADKDEAMTEPPAPSSETPTGRKRPKRAKRV